MSIISKIKAKKEKKKELEEKKKFEEACKILGLQFVTQEEFEDAIISNKPLILK